MMKKLVRADKAFPSWIFVAVSLLLCLSADGAPAAAQTRKRVNATDCASASNKNKPPCAIESPNGQVTVFWPKLRFGNATGRVFGSKIEVWIDKTNAGMVNGNEPLTLSLPNGTHKLELKPYDDFLENIRPIKESQITVSSQKPLYLQIVNQGVSIVASELDAPTAQAALSGGETKEETSTPAPQVAAPAVKDPKNKPNAKTASAAAAGNDTKTPSASATIYLYWPRPAAVFGFLDKYSADLPVFLDEKRIGGIKLGEYLLVQVPTGEHTLGLDVGLSGGRLLKEEFVIGAGSTRHFHIENHDTVRLFEDTPEEAADHGKGLSQRQIVR